MIAVVIPAHNERRLIGDCLRSVQAAARHPRLRHETVQIVVALDRCSDRTGAIARGLGACTVEVSGGVGVARAAGANLAIARGARWLAMTDADTTVPADWLAAQLDCGADAFCGVVGVADWRGHQAATRQAFERLECHQDGHAHVHGANLGVSAQAYTEVGGFPPLVSSEDVALVEALAAAGKRIARRGAPVVLTSARRTARAPRGFSEYLLQLEAALLAQPGL